MRFLLSTLFIMFISNCFSQTVYYNCIDGCVMIHTNSNLNFQLAPYDNSHSQLNNFILNHNITDISQPFKDLGGEPASIYRIKFSSINQVDQLINDLQQLSFISLAERAPLYRKSYQPNDLYLSQAWHLQKVNATRAWDISKGSKDVVIAIVDNGVRLDHQDIKNNLWINTKEIPGNFLDDDLNGYIDDYNGYDVADNDSDPNVPALTSDQSAFVHGTHVGGIASAVTDNLNGIASLGFNCKIMAVKCAPDNSDGESVPFAYDGLVYAIRANADIINMSFGSDEQSVTGQKLMNAAYSLGIILVAAAGNDNSLTPNYPAAFDHVISVAASDENDKKASFSNYGAEVDVTAPGTRILSSLAGTNMSYGFLSGTSMSTPMVSGLAGLLLSLNKNLSPEEVELAIKTGADEIDAINQNYAGYLGAGRINAYNSLTYVAGLAAFEVEKNTMKVYPNPSNGIFKIVFSETDSTVNRIRIINELGAIVFNKPVPTYPKFSPIKVQESNLSNGIYFLEAIKSDGKSIRGKIVINREE